MAEADFLEALAAWASHATSNFTAFASFTFAYLTACYFAAAKMSRNQALILSALYIVAAFSAVASVMSALEVIGLMLTEHPTFLNNSVYFQIDVWKLSIGSMTCLIMASSLFFMYQTRRQGAT